MGINNGLIIEFIRDCTYKKTTIYPIALTTVGCIFICAKDNLQNCFPSVIASKSNELTHVYIDKSGEGGFFTPQNGLVIGY